MENDDGPATWKKSFQLSLSAEPLNLNDLIPGCYRTYGSKTVSQLFLKTEKYLYATIHMEYDYSDDQLSVRWIYATDPLDKDAHRYHSTSLTPYLVYRWTGIPRPPAIYDTAAGTAILHSKDMLDFRVITRNLGAGIPHLKSLVPSLRCFSDREVLGLAGEGGIEFFFFNPNFNPNVPEGLEDCDEFTDNYADLKSKICPKWTLPIPCINLRIFLLGHWLQQTCRSAYIDYNNT